jgi:hypothetical protein
MEYPYIEIFLEAKMKNIIFLFFCIFIANSINAQEKRIFSIPYNQYDFGANNLNGSLIILGWSRDGKIIYEHSAHNIIDNQPHGWRDFKSYYVFDLVSDETLFPVFEQYVPDFFMEGSDLSKRYVEKLSEQYNIEPIMSSVIGKFPYIGSDSKSYSIELTNISHTSNGNATYADMIVRQDFPPFYKKNVGKIAVLPIISPLNSGDWELIKRVEFFYIKSPFENRIAIIMSIPDVYNNSGDIIYFFNVRGCHLDVGFTK